MIFRQAQPRDRARIVSIWMEVFGDEEAVATRLLDDFAGPDNIYVAEEDGRVIAQLLTVPCECGGHTGAYLYALATVPEYRSRGIMEKLMDYAEEKVRAAGGSFLILIPASLSLFDYYLDRGFENIDLKSIELDLPDTSDNKYKVGEIPAELFIDIRSKYLGGDIVNFSTDRVDFELEEEWYYECSSVYCEDGYAIYMKEDDILFITEVAAATEVMARDLIAYAKKITGCETVRLTLPVESDLFSDVGTFSEQTPQAQFRWWGTGIPPNFYIRFALDDLPYRIKENKADKFA